MTFFGPGAVGPYSFPGRFTGYHHTQPYTVSDGATFRTEIEEIKYWLLHVLGPNMESEIDRLTKATLETILHLEAAVNEAAASAQQAATIAATLVELKGQVAAIAADVRADALSASTSSTEARQSAMDAVAAAERAENAANGLTTDAVLRTILGNTSSTSRQFLDARYLTTATQVASMVDEAVLLDKLSTKFERLPRPHAVIVGSSNAPTGSTAWPAKLGAIHGWTVQNYAVGGTGFTQGDGGGDNNYLQQLQKAQASTAFANSEVGFVIVADAGNDIRGKASVTTPATAVVNYAKSNFPNARVIILPVLWGPPSGTMNWNGLPEQWDTLVKVVNELRSVTRNGNVEFVDYSWLWHWRDASFMLPNEVHYTTRGHDEIVGWMNAYLAGDSTKPVSGWAAVTSAAPSVTMPESVGGHRPLRVRLDGETVTIDGHMMSSSSANGANSDWATIPQGFRPMWPIDVNARLMNTETNLRFILYPNGVVRLSTERNVPTSVYIHQTYDIT